LVLAHAHRHFASTHVHDNGLELSALAIEKSDLIVGLQPENLHVPGRSSRQAQFGTGIERRWTVKAWQI
jgi:hypothetical protein